VQMLPIVFQEKIDKGHMLNKLYILMLFALSYSCSNKSKRCAYTKADFIAMENNRVFGTWSENNNILEYRDKSFDSIVGGYYVFSEKGLLLNYQFFADTTNYTYSEQYDSLGNLLNVEGSPFVWNLIKKTSDSIYLTSFIFRLNKGLVELKVTLGDSSFNVVPKKDSLFSNMARIEINLSKRRFENDSVFYDTFIFSNCSNSSARVRDTVLISK
jgi:hypothetical protein